MITAIKSMAQIKQQYHNSIFDEIEILIQIKL